MDRRSTEESVPNPGAGGSISQPMPFWLASALIVAAVFWIYSPVFHGDWLWDDDAYVTNQPLVRDLHGLWQSWFAPGSWNEYYPLEETLLWIEWHLFGADTLGYHLVTITLHSLNALLVWRLLHRLGLPKAWIGGLIFAVHPAAVDSVAWIAETKNTLSTLPGLLAMIAWIDYENERKPRDYAHALLYFTCGMLCKIAVAPLPTVLLLYAWWKRRRIERSDIKAVAPFFAISLALGLLSLACDGWYNRSHDQFFEDPAIGGLLFRIALAGEALTHFLAHYFWPVSLLPIYPLWKVGASSPLAFLPWLGVLSTAFCCWRYRSGWGRHALLGGGFFVLFVAPFLGFHSASYMNFTWIMDHFLYLAMIGPIGLSVAALQLMESVATAAKPAVTGIVTVVVTLLAFEAHAYASVYTDETSLWSFTLKSYPNSWLAHYDLANAYFISGDFSKAIWEYEAALRYRPDYVMALNNLGLAYAQTGRLAEAKAQFEAALRLMPGFVSAQHNLEHANALLNPPATPP